MICPQQIATVTSLSCLCETFFCTQLIDCVTSYSFLRLSPQHPYCRWYPGPAAHLAVASSAEENLGWSLLWRIVGASPVDSDCHSLYCRETTIFRKNKVSIILFSRNQTAQKGPLCDMNFAVIEPFSDGCQKFKAKQVHRQ